VRTRRWSKSRRYSHQADDLALDGEQRIDALHRLDGALFTVIILASAGTAASSAWMRSALST
jgi:hypothetical protein